MNDGILIHDGNALLVAKGYTQLYEVDYEETFSPVAGIRAIRILISITAFIDPESSQQSMASFKDPFMVLSKHQEAGIKDLMKKSKEKGQSDLINWSKCLSLITTILKRYKMDNFKRGHILMQERLDLNKIQGASTPKEVKRMQNVPYALVVGSIMYAVIAC
ncbi:hypothetical protein Tco_0360808 [Tanacetum coccineum]